MANDQGYYGSRDTSKQELKTLQAEFRKLRDYVSSISSQNIDMDGRRVTNARHSRNDHDYIIKAELNNAVEQVKKYFLEETRPPIQIDLSQYTLSYEVDRLNYGSLSLYDISVSKDGSVVNISDIPVDGLYVVAACVDELRLQGSQNEVLLVAIPSLQNEVTMSVVGITPTGWQVGDYILINDQNPDPIGSCFSYEILKITNIVGPLVTLVRDGSPPGDYFSWFGTPKSGHLGSFKAYKVDILNFPFSLKSGIFYNPTARTGFAERVDLVIPNVCVVGVAAVLYNSSGLGRWTDQLLSTGYLAPHNWESGDLDSRSPGLRTLNGAAYYISTSGTLSVGLESDFEIRANDNSPIRCLWGYLKIAGQTIGSADPVVEVEVIEIDEATLAETVIETVEFYTANRVSGNPSYLPETRQLPYNPNPFLIGDYASNTWPVPFLKSDGVRYKTKVTAVGATIAGSDLVIVMSS